MWGEECEWVDVAEAVVLAADSEVQASVVGRAREGAEGCASLEVLARADGDRREREVGDAPATAAERDDPAGGADGAGEGDRSVARRADLRARRCREVDSSVPAALERVPARVERSRRLAGHRRQPGRDGDGESEGGHRRDPMCGARGSRRMERNRHGFGALLAQSPCK